VEPIISPLHSGKIIKVHYNVVEHLVLAGICFIDLLRFEISYKKEAICFDEVMVSFVKCLYVASCVTN
jgi:hypothetical protein